MTRTGVVTRSLRRIALAVGAMALVAPVGAQELRFELGLPTTSSFNTPLMNFAGKLGEVGIKATVSNGSILSLAEVCAGMRDGLVDGGLCLFPYNPNEFSEANLMATLSMLATSGSPADNPAAAMTGAMIEYVMLNCPECLDQIKTQNHVFLAAAATPSYDTLCRAGSHIETLADFTGKRIRSGGGNFSRVAEAFGAAPVVMKGTEVFDALDKGVIDCIMIAPSELIGLRLIEVTDQVLRGWPGGVYVGQAFPGMNRESWQSLSEEQRVFTLEAAADLAAEGVYSFTAGNEAGLAAAEKQGFSIVDIDAEIKAKADAFIQGDLAAIKAEFEGQYKLSGVDAKLVVAQELIEKWKGLTNGDLTKDKLAQLLKDEIYAKVDLTTYGTD